MHLVDAEHLEGGAGADDVDDGVDAADLVEVDLLGGRRCRRPSARASPAKVAWARARTRSGRRASSTSPWMWAAVRTTVVSAAFTWIEVPAIPPRRTGSASSSQPSTGSRRHSVRTSSRSAPASTRAPSAMSPAMPEKQWNQAMVKRRRWGR
ncbi:MAG: hypothetical protein WKF43_07345 [Acidimicrobiales bacterium]